MLKIKKGAVIAAAVAGSLALAGCANRGAASAACGDTTGSRVVAPSPLDEAPVNAYKPACKGQSSCKGKKYHAKHHKKKIVKKEKSTSETTFTSTESAGTPDAAK